MKIYTKKGDKGLTSLYGGDRVPKHHLRIEAYGTVDELNSHIGFLRDQEVSDETKSDLLKIQHELFVVGAMLATPEDKKLLKSGKERLNIDQLNEQSISFLEKSIDSMNSTLPEMTHFILPGGHPVVSICHIARCVCRRAERICTNLMELSTIEENILVYLNRLSDFLFVLARKLTKENRAEEIKWIPERFK